MCYCIAVGLLQSGQDELAKITLQYDTGWQKDADALKSQLLRIGSARDTPWERGGLSCATHLSNEKKPSAECWTGPVKTDSLRETSRGFESHSLRQTKTCSIQGWNTFFHWRFSMPPSFTGGGKNTSVKVEENNLLV